MPTIFQYDITEMSWIEVGYQTIDENEKSNLILFKTFGNLGQMFNQNYCFQFEYFYTDGENH